MSEAKENTKTVDVTKMKNVEPLPYLNLQDIKEISCYKPIDADDYYVYDCEPAKQYFGTCAVCGSSFLKRHGFLAEPRLVHDINIGNIQVDLLVKVPRYQCTSCLYSFAHKFESIPDNRQMTYRLMDFIRKEAFTRTFKEISDSYGYSEKTIADIFTSYAKELEDARGQIVAPRVLGIDEKHIVHKMRGVFVDNETGELLEMTKDNKKDTVISTIKGMKDYDKNIEVVTMDMSNGYRSFIQNCLPNATIIVDKYHVVQDMGRKVRATKTKLMEVVSSRIDQEQDAVTKKHLLDVQNLIGTNAYLFRFRFDNLGKKEARTKAMAEICATFPEFNYLRLLKEGFEKIYLCKTREKAERAFAEWKNLLPPKKGIKQIAEWEANTGLKADYYSEFITLANAIDRWHDEVFAYFDFDEGFTNATAEGYNRYIDSVNHAGSGYSFETLRLKMLFKKYAGKRVRYILSSKKTPIYESVSSAPNNAVGFKTFDRIKVVGYKEILIVEEVEEGSPDFIE